MATHTRTGPFTFADFLKLIPEVRKADLIDGAIYLAPPESLEHNALVLWLGTVIGLYIEEHRLGRLTVHKVAYRLSDLTAPEPDLALVITERLGIRKKGYVDGPPDLAIEVASPESVDRDYEDKRRRFEEAGVQEYWIVDPDESRATFLVRESDRFVEAQPVDDQYRSRVLKGFVLDVRWLWQRPLPATLAIVHSLLKTTN